MTAPTSVQCATHRPRVLGPGLMVGVGLGGFVDGILLHQTLQWHHMLSAPPEDARAPTFPVDTVAGLEVNTLWDGLFHATAWVFVVIGLYWLWRRLYGVPRPLPWRSLTGLLLAGWGVFNLVEGLVDHHLLRVHHVRDDVTNPLPWDLGFLALGAVLLVGGLLLHRSARSSQAS